MREGVETVRRFEATYRVKKKYRASKVLRRVVVSEGVFVDVVSGEYVARLAPTFEKVKNVAYKRRVEIV